MIHPLFKLLVKDPALLAEHASAYAELVQAQAGDAACAWRRRALLAGSAALFGMLGLFAAVTAALLAAALPGDAMPAPWLLVLLPAGLLAVAGGLALRLRREASRQHFGQLRAQWQEDVQLLHAAAQ